MLSLARHKRSRRGPRGKEKGVGTLVPALAVLALVALLSLPGCGGRGGAVVPGGAGDPVELVRTFMRSVEEEDVDLFLSCLVEGFPIPEPDEALGVSGDSGLDPRRFLEVSFGGVDFHFEGVELSVVEETPERATVSTVAGRLRMDPLGVPLLRDLRQEPLVFYAVRRKGRWYLENNPVPYITLGPGMPSLLGVGPGEKAPRDGRPGNRGIKYLYRKSWGSKRGMPSGTPLSCGL